MSFSTSWKSCNAHYIGRTKNFFYFHLILFPLNIILANFRNLKWSSIAVSWAFDFKFDFFLQNNSFLDLFILLEDYFFIFFIHFLLFYLIFLLFPRFLIVNSKEILNRGNPSLYHFLFMNNICRTIVKTYLFGYLKVFRTHLLVIFVMKSIIW